MMTASSSSSSYPYTRSDECSWQPEEFARHMAALSAPLAATIRSHRAAGASLEEERSSSPGPPPPPNSHSLSPTTAGAAAAAAAAAAGTTHLLSHGWSSRQVPVLRKLYGSNRMANDHEPADDSTNGGGGGSLLVRATFRRLAPVVGTIFSALLSQLKEPLILMLLGSAAVSVLLGNRADAASIGIALLIVALVAAVQEYRSEAALEKLANLVPHTCTVLRDGLVRDGFYAKDLVVGDLVLLATGEYVVVRRVQ
jgi:Ca2+-transporting ATPase